MLTMVIWIWKEEEEEEMFLHLQICQYIYAENMAQVRANMLTLTPPRRSAQIACHPM